MDVAGPFPKSGAGNKYILVVVSRDSLRCTLKNVFLNLGTPGSIHTDQGSNFQSHLFQDFCKRLGVFNP